MFLYSSYCMCKYIAMLWSCGATLLKYEFYHGITLLAVGEMFIWKVLMCSPTLSIKAIYFYV